jgi:Winged helix DNA-binding domain
VAERVVSRRGLNRAVLARQLLLERGRGAIPATLERVGGLQAQYAPSMYVGLWSRLEGLERRDLTDAIERRAVVQATLMRATIHLVARDDYWPFAIATREARRRLWRRGRPGAAAEAAMEVAAARLRPMFAGAPIARREVVALLGGDVAQGIGHWLDCVRAPPSGTWERRRADLYALAEEWVGPEPPMGRDEAVGHVVRRYLAAFGPAPRTDVADWAGLPASEVARALGLMRLRIMRGEDGEELLDLPRAPLPDPETPAPPRFLPTWDAVLLVHARRAGVLPEEYRPRIFSTRMPASLPTFLVDGAVAGTWRHEDGRIALDPFRRLSAAERRALDAEAERLLAFHAPVSGAGAPPRRRRAG